METGTDFPTNKIECICSEVPKCSINDVAISGGKSRIYLACYYSYSFYAPGAKRIAPVIQRSTFIGSIRPYLCFSAGYLCYRVLDRITIPVFHCIGLHWY